MPDNQIKEQNPFLFYFLNVEASISAIACIWLLYSATKSKSSYLSISMICWIGLYDLFQALFLIAFFQIDISSETALLIEAFVGFANAGSMFWSVMLSFSSYKILVSKKKYNFFAFYRICIIFAMVLGFIAGFGPYFVQKYTQNMDYQVKTRQIIYSTIMVLAMGTSIFCYIAQTKYIKKHFQKRQLEAFNIRIGKLAIYPIVLLFVYIPIEIVQLYQDVPLVVFDVSHILYVSSGVINSLVYYGLNNQKERKGCSFDTTANPSIDIDTKTQAFDSDEQVNGRDFSFSEKADEKALLYEALKDY